MAAPRKPAPESVEEPPEAQPPAGVTLDEPALADALDADVVGTPETVEASEGEMAALLTALDLDPQADPDVLAPPAPREPWSPFVGGFVSYVTGRADVDAFGPGSAPADVFPALVVAIGDGTVDLRVFIRAEGVPFRAGVPLILDPGEVTLDHQGHCYRKAGV